MNPRISVIVMTHGSEHRVAEIINALSRQTVAPGSFELILITPDGVDRTAEIMRKAKAPILLFLEDNQVPIPHLLEAHIKAHETDPGSIILGARQMCEDGPARLADPAHRFVFQDIGDGNFSIATELFRSVAGFDEEMPGLNGAAQELAVRVLRRGVRFRYVPKATCVQHDAETYRAALRQTRDDGYNFALIVRKHPELFWSCKLDSLSRLQYPPFTFIWKLLWKHPWLADVGAAIASVCARLTGGFKLNGLASRFDRIVVGHAYWRGVHAALGSSETLEMMFQNAPPAPESAEEVEIDIASDYAHLDSILDRQHADAVLLYCRDTPLARIWPEPGAERLSGAHVRKQITSRFSSLLLALLMDEHFTRKEPDADSEFASPAAKRRDFGST